MPRLHVRSTHKYGAQPTMVDGIRFASKKESARYVELKHLEKTGEIRDLGCQPRFPLTVQRAGALTLFAGEVIGCYVADFDYIDCHGERVVEDVKGYDVPLQKWKRQHAEVQYGIEVRLIR